MTLNFMTNRRNRAWLGRFLRNLDSVPRKTKVTILLAFDLLILTVVAFAAFVIRFGGELNPTQYQVALLMAAPPITCACLYALRAYGNVSRLHASSVEGALALAISISALIWAFMILGLGAEGFPRSVVVLYGGLSIIVYITLRRTIAWLFRVGHTRRANDGSITAIFGVNQFGSTLAQTLRTSGLSRPVAFIDNDPGNIGRRVSGLPVISLGQLPAYVDELGIDTVILALTQRSRQRSRALIEELSKLSVRVQTIAPPEDILSGRVSISDLRPINIEDVLGRDPIVPNRDLMARAIAGKRILVTGAGGSIGSELVRQALAFDPTTLVLVEMSEVALYNIENEAREILATSGASVELIPVLGSVCDQSLVMRTMVSYRTEVVLHAAAYKHVPLGESNAASCVTNNVIGTAVLTDCAIEAGVELFLLISTDKAVRPTNIMGATKRFAELILQDRAERQSTTRFTMVRFGNVLGSSGSVIPLFRSQIEKGGPVTVTDPRMVRYFMTIPEAVELVLQAAGMAQGGEVFVLDMGEPVKIDTLARTLISLSNLTIRDENNPHGDIDIVYTGIRPGEKMYEELLISGNVIETSHPRIMRCIENCLASDVLAAVLATLDEAARAGNDDKIRKCIESVVEGFEGASPADAA